MASSDPQSLWATAKDVLASVVGSAACVYTGQPFDTIKVRLQAGHFVNPLQVITLTVREEGVTALWRGSVPAFAGALGENAVAFGVNGFLSRAMSARGSEQETATQAFIKPFVTGGITGACVPFVLCPCDVLKCRAQMNRASGQNSSLWYITKTTLSKQGLSGLYVGFGIQFARDVIFYSSFFGTYDVSCKLMRKYTSLTDTSIYFISGGLAGQVAWALSISTDTIKTRIQTSSSYPAPSIAQIYGDVVRSHGYRGFFNGLGVALIRAFPANAALFVGYELTKNGLNAIAPG